jgi:hypothetical protein
METGPSPIFFPEDSTKIQFELAGLLARLAFCGLPVLPQARQWQRLQKHNRGLQLRVQLRHRTGFPFQMSYLNTKNTKYSPSDTKKFLVKPGAFFCGLCG